MTAPEPGDRLARYFARHFMFWSENQRRAFRIGSNLAGVPATRAGAESWKRERGAAFSAWRELSKSRRKAMLADGAP